MSVFAIFGGAEVLVPDDVAVRVTGVSVFGGLKVRGHEVGNGIFSVTLDSRLRATLKAAAHRRNIDLRRGED